MMSKVSAVQAKLIYAVVMAVCMCVIMSAVTTSILTEAGEFWLRWPKVLGLDLMVAIPVAVALGPIIRRLIDAISAPSH